MSFNLMSNSHTVPLSYHIVSIFSLKTGPSLIFTCCCLWEGMVDHCSPNNYILSMGIPDSSHGAKAKKFHLMPDPSWSWFHSPFCPGFPSAHGCSVSFWNWEDEEGIMELGLLTLTVLDISVENYILFAIFIFSSIYLTKWIIFLLPQF